MLNSNVFYTSEKSIIHGFNCDKLNHSALPRNNAMNKRFILIVFSFLVFFVKTGLADQFNLPLQVDYSLIKNALVSELFTGTGKTANLWNDRQGCSYLKLSDPRIGRQDGQIRLLNNVDARVGAPMGGQCLTVLEWAGVLETLQKPTIDAGQSILSFPVTRATAYDAQGRQLTIDRLQDMISRFVEPKLGGLKVDLKHSRGDIERAVAEYLPKENEAEMREILNTLKFSSAAATNDGIAVKFAFDAPIKPVSPKSAAPLTEAEQKQWQAAWRHWDDFLNKAIQQASNDTQSPELKDTLMEILLESRSAFQAGLKDHNQQGEDPVRVFFTHTWERLAPELKTIAKQLPEIQGLRYMTFIAATDVIYELENIGRPFDLEISSDGLRKLGRMLIAGQQERAESGKPDAGSWLSDWNFNENQSSPVLSRDARFCASKDPAPGFTSRPSSAGMIY